MLTNIQNGTLPLVNGDMHYIRFGKGERALVMLPGLGDGLMTVKGKALPMAAMYRIFSRAFTVYMFSRRNNLSPGDTTRSMARDTAQAMHALGIEKADVLGVSMGGMIAQHLAADYPEKVRRLVLAVTCACANPVLEASVQEWIALARRGDYSGLMHSQFRRMYSEAYCRRNRWMIPLVCGLTKPKSFDRFLIQAGACLGHNAQESLSKIEASTLVIGGERDAALGAQPSREMAEAIPGASLRMYADWGHALYEEAPDFNRIVLDFLCAEEPLAD